jgi:hypothetical protein
MGKIAIAGAALAAGLLLGAGLSARAQDSAPPFLGSVGARTYTHSYKMPLDVGVDLDFKPAERIDEQRQLVLVPDLYGDLIHVTEHGDDVVMWFRDEEGIIRNAVIQGVAARLVNLQRAPARHIGYSYR